MQAINDRVIIRVGMMIQSSGGVIFASQTIDNGRIALNIGKVISCGDGVTLRTGELIPVKVKEGDVIVWEQFGAIRFEVLGPDIVCVRSEDIGAVLTEDEWKGKYLFEPEEIEAYQKKLESDREEQLRKIREAQAKPVTMKSYQCWTDWCKEKGGRFVDCEEGENKCRMCGEPMLQKDRPPDVSRNNITPLFHG